MFLHDVSLGAKNYSLLYTIPIDITNALKASQIMTFQCVSGHYGIPGNIKVDKLAVGVQQIKKQDPYQKKEP